MQKYLAKKLNSSPIHEDCSHFTALKRFSVSGPHLVNRTVLEVKFTCIIIMFCEEIFCFDVFGLFRAGDLTILFEG